METSTECSMVTGRYSGTMGMRHGNQFKKGDPLELAKNAFENNLTNANGWKWDKDYKRYLKYFERLIQP